ncbi:unnamed protein product [Musa acuminata var. zebrina]
MDRKAIFSLPAVSFILVLELLVASISHAESWEYTPPPACSNCTPCDTCYSSSPPPAYIKYLAPPPPPPPPPPARSECPPTTVVQCCQIPPPPQPSSYLPYYNYSASPPLRLSGQVSGSLLVTVVLLCFFQSY